MCASMRQILSVAVPLFGFALLFLGAPAAHAAYQIEQIPGGDQVFGDFVVGPTKIDLTIAPGTEKTLELMVTNRMGERKQFNLQIEDAKGSDDVRNPVVLLGDDRGPYSLKDYIHFPEASFELGQGERARIPVTISIPADAQPGGLYGSVLVTTASLPNGGDQTVQSGAKSGSVVVSRVGSLFFITVPGDVQKGGEVSSFTTSGNKKYFSSGPIGFDILYHNSGNIHLAPYGSISIKNMMGDEVGVITSDPWYAFPQSTRLRQLTWERPYMFGKYTATAKINRGYDNIVDEKSVTFYVIPWKIVGGAFLALLLVFFFLRFLVRTFEIKKK